MGIGFDLGKMDGQFPDPKVSSQALSSLSQFLGQVPSQKARPLGIPWLGLCLQALFNSEGQRCHRVLENCWSSQRYFEIGFIAGAFILREVLAVPPFLAIARATRVTLLITLALDKGEALTVRTGAISCEHWSIAAVWSMRKAVLREIGRLGSYVRLQPRRDDFHNTG